MCFQILYLKFCDRSSIFLISICLLCIGEYILHVQFQFQFEHDLNSAVAINCVYYLSIDVWMDIYLSPTIIASKNESL